MRNVVLLAIFAVMGVGVVYRGLRFRSGSDRRLLDLYRRKSLPAILRNVPLLMPILGVLMIATATAWAPPLLGLNLPGISSNGTRAIGLVSIGLAGVVGGAMIILLIWPPSWAVPAWLREDDSRIGYRSPTVGVSDWLTAGFGAFLIFVGILIVLYGATGSVDYR